MHKSVYSSIKILRNCLLFCFTVLPCLSYASGETPVSRGMGWLIDAMNGATGIAIATLAVIVVGLLCLAHYLKWIHILYTVVGISIIFGASAAVREIVARIHGI